MKDQIKTLKSNLKALAKEIKNNKKLRKKSHPYHDKYIGDYPLLKLRVQFRHKHVAYCLARGKTLEQVDSGINLDLDLVNWLVKLITNPDCKEKLYVVVDEKLSTAQQAVQSAHAVAEFMLKNPYTLWKNGHLIILKDQPTSRNGMLRAYVQGYCEYAEFKEPDIGNKITAYAVFGEMAERAMKSKVLL